MTSMAMPCGTHSSLMDQVKTWFNPKWEWFKTTRVYSALGWLYEKFTNPTLNLLTSVVFVMAFELFAFYVTGYTGWWFWLSIAALSSAVFFLRVNEIARERKVKIVFAWYFGIAALTWLDPMGLMIYGLPWTLQFIVGTYVSAIYSVAVSLIAAVMSYQA